MPENLLSSTTRDTASRNDSPSEFHKQNPVVFDDFCHLSHQQELDALLKYSKEELAKIILQSLDVIRQKNQEENNGNA